MSAIVALIVLSIAGISNAGYLWWQHRKPGPLICPFNHDCSAVTESKWSKIFGIRNEVFGLAFYFALIVGGLIMVYLPTYFSVVRTLIRIGASGAVLYSLFLISIQIFKIRNYCFYCLLSALISFLIFLTAVFFI